MQASPELERLAGTVLRVTRLPHATAAMRLDGQELGIFSAEQFAAGVDVAALDMPLARRAADVAKLVELRNRVQFIRWRKLAATVATGPPPPANQLAEELAAIERELAALELAAARPAPHTIEIIATEP